jgi:bifunctional non-homologous end joining protein LigD
MTNDNTGFPEKIDAMKAATVPQHDLNCYEQAGWFAQEKLDGTRIIDIKKSCKLSMMSRSWKNDFSDAYPEIASELRQIPDNSILDGELVFYRKDNGKPEFVTALATPEVKKLYDIRLMLFDCLMWNGTDLTMNNQLYRTEQVEKIVGNYGWQSVGFIPTVRSGFNDFFKKITDNGGEGIVLKNMCSKYIVGTRSNNWLKVKRAETDDCVILGLAEGKGKYSCSFGALVVGQFINGKMQVVSRVSGMTDAERMEFNQKVRSMPAYNGLGDDFWKGATGKDVFHKVAPNMVVEVEFMERTPYGMMRHPRFLRVRDDKSWEECVAQIGGEKDG